MSHLEAMEKRFILLIIEAARRRVSCDAMEGVPLYEECKKRLDAIASFSPSKREEILQKIAKEINV